MVLWFIPQPCKRTLYDWCFKLGRSLGRNVSARVCLLPFGLALKITSDPSANEATALRLIGNLRGVRTPFLVDSAASTEKAYLLTTWVAGPTVGDVWDDLSASDKDAVVEDLQHQMDSMRRQTTSPSSHPISNVIGGPIGDHRIPWATPQVYKSNREFAKQVWIGLEMPGIRDTLSPVIRSFIERDVAVVFTHGDFLMRNLIIPISVEHWRVSGESICIVDWETAGWMPVYWEPLKATWLECEKETEWMGVIRRIFPECHAELDADWRWRSESNIVIL